MKIAVAHEIHLEDPSTEEAKDHVSLSQFGFARWSRKRKLLLEEAAEEEVMNIAFKVSSTANYIPSRKHS